MVARIIGTVLFGLIVAIALTTPGCGGKAKTPPTVVKGSLQTAMDLNPDIRGRSSPLMVRIYELKSVSTFNGADFYSLFDKDEQVLAKDIQGREELALRPGDRKTFERELKPDSHFIAVLAAYRDIERATWRGVLEIPPGKTTQVSIYAGKLSVSITGKQEEPEPKRKKLLPW